ncbi:hypothetical protein [Clostridium botulinum]|uniref:hypothetical protein n=1 Tax=Clostridium botulinum TaxID=1491 RepID=UPI001C9B5A40|nr:hypothetical protein [Clostridium botulinum]MBY6860770.1 hypothetical protein [Clostridium botulinum]MBY7043841.1 hypothetical protein [Clostridium botulinum]
MLKKINVMMNIPKEVIAERINDLKKDIIEFTELELHSVNERDKFRYGLLKTECECLLKTNEDVLKDLNSNNNSFDFVKFIINSMKND